MEVKKRILEAAEELFLKYGVKSVTMDEVARYLAISKKTIYQYYQDKDEIVSVVIGQYMEREESHMGSLCGVSADAIDEMLRASNRMRWMMSKINPSLLFDLQKYHPQAWKIYLNHKRHFLLECITNNLQRGVAEGLYRPDIHVGILARLRIEQVQLAFDASVFPVDQFNFIDIQTQLIEHFLRGIATEKGLQLIKQHTAHHQQTIYSPK